MNLLEMEALVGGGLLDEETAGFVDGLVCGIGIGLLLTGVGSLLGWSLTGYGCGRALGIL